MTRLEFILETITGFLFMITLFGSAWFCLVVFS